MCAVTRRRPPIPRPERRMRNVLALAVVLALVCYGALWRAWGATPVLVAIGAAVMVMAGVARWVTQYPNNEE